MLEKSIKRGAECKDSTSANTSELQTHTNGHRNARGATADTEDSDQACFVKLTEESLVVGMPQTLTHHHTNGVAAESIQSIVSESTFPWKVEIQFQRLTECISGDDDLLEECTYTMSVGVRSEWQAHVLSANLSSVTKRMFAPGQSKLLHQLPLREAGSPQESDGSKSPMVITQKAPSSENFYADLETSLMSSTVTTRSSHKDLEKKPELCEKLLTDFSLRWTHAGNDQTQFPLSVQQASCKVAFHFWPAPKLAGRLGKRENILPKLFVYAVPITRTERYACLITALNSAFFVGTFLFRADCVMAPKPMICSSTNQGWYWKYIPTWDTIFATLFGLSCSIPVPLLLRTLFKKTPHMEQLSDKEKRIRLLQLRFWQSVAWLIVLILNLFYIYWLSVFSNEYSWELFSRWFKTAYVAVIHKLVSAPLIRAAVFFLVLTCSMVSGLCDPLLVFFPHVLPVDPAFDSELKFDRGFREEARDDDDNAVWPRCKSRRLKGERR